MRLFLENINIAKTEESFMAFDLVLSKFEFRWHYHPEYEITLIKNGFGKRIIGDSFESFDNGDLVIIGPNIPHTWISHHLVEPPLTSTVIQFTETFINSFLTHEESASIKSLLEKSKRGLCLNISTNQRIFELVTGLPAQKGFGRIINLLELLNCLSLSDINILTSPAYQPIRGREQEGRINTVCGFLQKNYTGQISIQQTANMVHLSESAFCRFFKRATGKTFSDYINELRISQACHLLTFTDKPIATIATESGFESLTYFNRIFLKKRAVTPMQFRKSFSNN